MCSIEEEHGLSSSRLKAITLIINDASKMAILLIIYSVHFSEYFNGVHNIMLCTMLLIINFPRSINHDWQRQGQTLFISALL